MLPPVRPALALLLVVLAAPAADAQRLASRAVRNEGGSVRVTWTMSDEAGVSAYRVLRSTPTSNGDFVRLQDVVPHGVDRPYEYVDRDLYKEASSLAEYKVVAVRAEGLWEVFVAQVNYTATGIRRTWGSIKAMFQ